MTIDPVLEPPVAIGFLTVADRSPQGLVGGLLVLNAHARPLEFHTTVPLRPNRTQEILYGPTLKPFFYGEQIGLTLVRASKLRPLAVFTDCRPALAMAPHVDMPVWLVLAPPREAPRAEQSRIADVEGGEPTQLSTAAGGAIVETPRYDHCVEVMARRFDSAEELPAGFATLQCGTNRLARPASAAVVAANGPAPGGAIEEQLATIASALDLSEPFERIRAAIEEAQRGVR